MITPLEPRNLDRPLAHRDLAQSFTLQRIADHQ